MTTDTMAGLLAASPIVPVAVIDDVEQARRAGEALAAGGITCMEITLRTPPAIAAIEALAGHPDFTVGAGTIKTVEQARQAIDAGARFIVCPGLDTGVIDICQQHGIPVLPGTATASEIQQAEKLGIDIVKFFPAEPLGGPTAITLLAGPFSEVQFVPSGGIGAHNLDAYLSVANVIAVSGNWTVTPDHMRTSQWDEISTLAREAMACAHQHRPLETSPADIANVHHA